MAGQNAPKFAVLAGIQTFFLNKCCWRVTRLWLTSGVLRKLILMTFASIMAAFIEERVLGATPPAQKHLACGIFYNNKIINSVRLSGRHYNR